MLTEVNIADAVINDNSNKIYGFEPAECRGTSIVFHGMNNILYLEEGLRFKDVEIEFKGNNSIVYISSNTNWCYEKITVESNAACVIGHDVFVSAIRALKITCGTGDNVVIGNDGLIEAAAKIDTRKSKSNKKKGRNILIGSHVCLGQETIIGGNSIIKGGAVIGADSVIADAEVPGGCICFSQGDEIRISREHIAFTKQSVHNVSRTDDRTFDTISEEHLADIQRIAGDGWEHVMEVLAGSETAAEKLEKLLETAEKRTYVPHMYERTEPKRSVRSFEDISLKYAAMKGLRVNKKSNTVLGEYETVSNFKLTFKGKGNVVIFEEGVSFYNSRITFEGDNAIAYISKGKTPYCFVVSIHTDAAMYIGEDAEFPKEGKVPLISVAEARNLIIGKGCKLENGVYIRTSDQHPIYDVKTHKRINPPQNIIIGDDITLKENTFVTKGEKIGLKSGLFGDRYERYMDKIQNATNIDEKRVILCRI